MAGKIGTIALTLSPAAPVVEIKGTIDAYGTAGVYGGATFFAAVFGPSDGSFHVHNRGKIESNGTSGDDAGILLGAPGHVINSGSILAANGIEMFGGAGGEIANRGDIDATLGIGAYVQGAGVVENSGVLKGLVGGIVLAGGGYTENTGRVDGAAGILLGGGPGSYVYNTGAVKANKRDGISLSADGYVNNTGHIKAGHDGIVMGGGGIAYNSGNIQAAKDGIYAAGGTVFNYAAGRISGAPFGVYLTAAGAVENAGTIEAGGGKSGTVGAAVGLEGGGYVYNAASGRLAGISGVAAQGGALDVVNKGVIYGSGSRNDPNAAGIYAAAGGTVLNAGTIAGDQRYFPGVFGILIDGGAGTVTNTGLMTGYFYGAAVALRDGGTVTNTGVIQVVGGTAAGILLQQGGLVGNSGYVSGVYAGGGAIVTNTGTILGVVTLAGGGLMDNSGGVRALGGFAVEGGGTVLNEGLIAGLGNAAYALSFQSGFSNELILTPDAQLAGNVFGGGGVLDLASGSSAGDINFDGRFTGFAEVTVDAHAVWDFAAGSSLAAGTMVDNDGKVLAQGSVGVTIAGAILGSGLINSGAGPLTLDGSVAAGQAIVLGGADETLFLGDAAGFSGTIENFAAGDAIDLTGVASSLVTGVTFSGGVLTVSEADASYQLTFANPGTFMNESFSFFRDHGSAGITLSSKAQMAFLTPSGAAAAASTVQLPAVSYVPLAASAVPRSAAHAGWMETVLQHHLAASAPVVTLQG